MTGHGPGQVLFHFVRHWARRPVTASAADAGGDQGRLVLVCEAVHALGRRGTPATVNAIAYEIGIDQSSASRLVKSATAAGYVLMAASPADGRRREASLTAAGRSMLDQAHRWQEEIFARLTAGWSDKRRRDFQQAMTDLMDRSYALDAPATRTLR
ncbi:MarR family winged helix-turn-helix transcriptional regulator [Nonomuraea sp. NPDC050783]|uniref:MarR family winged helix-turn-helix transcriptional regulator n=1 Tax=Nonomuraea sp. NPDC050783 TaxID=3154634 RepID=UPI00346545AD